jgi:hypothetical protein
MQMSGQLYATAWKKKILYPLNTRLGGLWNWSGHSGDEENPFSLPGIKSRILQAAV